MSPHARAWAAFAAGLASLALVLAVLVWSGGASLRVATLRFGEDRVAPWGGPPPLPAFPERVVTLDPFNGRLETLHDSLSFFYSEAVRSRYRGVRRIADASRHRSLELNDRIGANDPSLIAALSADARAKGWTVVPELTVDGVAANATLGLERNGYVIFVVALSDAFALVGGNPGASMDVLNQRFDCPDDGPVREPGLAPCDPGGFAPVWIWTNLPEPRRGRLELAPRASVAEGTNVWSRPWSWEEFTRVATVGSP